MDSGPHVTASRVKKLTKRQKCKEGEDMISKLPDFIIGRILSFLPTKEAVRTSVLSKRWIYLWTFITQLSFEDRDPYAYEEINKTCFINFVYRVLLHLNSSSIQSFSLVIAEGYDSSHIDQWISAVLNRKVKKLCVDSYEKLNLASHTLLKCQSLEELVLKMDWCVTRVPTFVCLSSLTVLKLTGIQLTSYSSNDSKKLALHFPVLKKYKAKYCTWCGVESVTLEVPLLEVVSIGYCPVRAETAEIKFCAPRLAEFHYSGNRLSETILLATQIPSANFTIFSNEKIMQEAGFPVCKHLNNNVEFLKLKLIHGESQQVKDSLADIPAFGMLSRLELHLVTGELLLGLLLKSPCLKTLVLEALLDFDEELLNYATMPDCCLSTLKVVRFEGIVLYDHELRFAKFVKENAKVMERISFSGGIKLCSSNLEEAKEMLKKSFTIVDVSSD